LLPWVAKKLDLESHEPPKKKMPLEIVAGEIIPSELKEIEIPADSPVDGKTIVELNLPPGYLIVLISRAGAYIQPTGNTMLKSGDRLLSLTEKDALEKARGILCDKCE
jgi:potassium/hydrogen antiporter